MMPRSRAGWRHRGRTAAAGFLAATALVIAAGAGAELQVRSPAGADAPVALFVADTVVDVPGGTSVGVRLEVRCSGGDPRYVVVDFQTPRLGRETATLDARLRQHFADTAGAVGGRWRIHYDVLEWRERPPDDHAALHNLQLDRMVFLGDARAWIEQATGAGYLAIEHPARGRRQFLFELSHVGGELRRLAPHCGL